MSDFGQRPRESSVTVLALFAASGTLICCALPIVLVSLGLGSAVVALTGTLPWLIALSQHKAWVFALSAVMLALAGVLLFRSGRACPTDPEVARLCRRVDAWNRRIYWVSVGLWIAGFAAAYLLLPVTRMLDRVP